MYRKGPFIVLRLIGILLLIGLIAGGGFMAYKAGFAEGVAQAPEVAQAIQQAAENGQAVAVPPMIYPHGYEYGFGPGFYPYHHFGFFPIGGICMSIFFLFFFLGFMKMIFFRGMGWGYRGPHGHQWSGPPWMKPEDKEGDKKDESPEEKK